MHKASVRLVLNGSASRFRGTLTEPMIVFSQNEILTQRQRA